MAAFGARLCRYYRGVVNMGGSSLSGDRHYRGIANIGGRYYRGAVTIGESLLLRSTKLHLKLTGRSFLFKTKDGNL